MLQRTFYAAVILAAFILLTGMGSGGGFERAPRVEKNFAVTITDTAGNKISGNKFSWEGRLHFQGYLGMAAVTMPFERVKELTVGGQKERNVRVTARLIDGSEAQFDIDATSRCFGEASFGSFMLHMNEIRSVVFTQQ